MDFAQEVKAGADIVTVVGSHVRLRRQGGHRYVGLCPFHSEKTPSFSVSSDLQIYKCFGCGKGGDVFSFLMEIQGLTFFEAVKSLAEQQGKQMPRTGKGAGADTAARRRDALHQIHEIAQEFYTAELVSRRGAQALRYLQDRGLGPEDIEEFGVGYAPLGNALLGHLKGRGFKRGEVLESGLVGKSESGGSVYDRFRDRLMFPIHSDAGQLIGYGGRLREADKGPKYLNSPDTPIYRKNSVLFNLHRARTAMRQRNRAVLVEGYMDVIGVWRAGIRNAVATCGTALTAQQVAKIRRHCDTVVVNFDSDAAGQSAAERSVELLLREGMNVRVLELPDGMDPDEYCRAHGADAYLDQLEQAPRYFHWLLDRSRRQFDLDTSEGRTAAFDRLLQSVLLLPNEIQRATTITELADHIGLQQGVALNRLRQGTNQRERSRSSEANPTDSLSPSERLLIVVLVQNSDARAELLQAAFELAGRGLPSRSILSAMWSAEQSERPFDYGSVEGRLGDDDRDRLSRLVFDRDRPAESIQAAREALEALRRQVREARHREVLRQIRTADRSGDQQELMDLLQQKMVLEKELGLTGGQRS